MKISGSKGGSSGSSFKQTPDNLRSIDTFEGVLGLGLGPFKGPKRGLKSIKIDGTAIENENGQLNFPDFVPTFADGNPASFPQPVQLKLGAGASPQQVGVSLTQNVWVTRTLNNVNADFIDLRFIVSQLFRQDSKGIYNLTATLEIQMKPVGKTNWINPTLGSVTAKYNEQGQTVNGLQGAALKVLLARNNYDANGNWIANKQNYAVTGKTSSPAAYELRIAVPSEGAYADTGWDVRVRLIERDNYENNTDIEKRTLSWESMAAVYSDVLGTHEDWRGVAWLQLYGKASDQLTGVPEVTGEYDTKIVSVPPANVFEPESRQYTSAVWDGSWTKAFTNDPAWALSDLISDSLSGLSMLAPGSYLNKWDALEMSKWCSQLVPDGDGGTHPRYSMNVAISEPQKAEELVRYIAGAVGGLAWDEGDGQWRVKMDKPDTPADIFTLENIEGEFLYANTDVDTRYNDITGSFKNAEMDYREDRVRLYDNVSIARIGRKPTTIALVGCTNRQEAMRRIKLRLRSAVNESRIVNFVTNRRGKNLNQLDLILIADGDLGDQDKRTTGRTIAVSGDRKTITLRDSVYLAAGVSYRLRFATINSVYNPDPSSQPANAEWRKPTIVATANVTTSAGSGGNFTTLTLDQALPVDVADNLAVALEAASLPTLPKLYRITNIKRDDDGERIAISAIEVDTGKWDAADNVSKQDTIFQDLRGPVPKPQLPLSGELLSLIAVPTDDSIQVNLVANWIRPPGVYITGFRVRYRINGGAWKVSAQRTPFTTHEIVNPTVGVYEVEVVTLDRRGTESLPLVGLYGVTQDQISNISNRIDGVQSSVERLASDGWLVHGKEKQEAILNLAVVTSEYNSLKAEYEGSNSPSNATGAYNTATDKYQALLTFLGGLTPEWNDVNVDTPLPDPALWNTRWSEAISALNAFQTALITSGVDGLPGAPGTNSYGHYAYANAPDGSIDFTVGAPGTRAYEGFYTDSNPIDSNNPASYTWREYKGPPFGMAARGYAVIAGNLVIKNSSGPDGVWDSEAFSTIGYRNGAVASFQGDHTGPTNIMVGLNTDVLGASDYQNIDYAWQLYPGGSAIYEGGAYSGYYGAWDSSVVFQVAYDGRYVRYMKGETEVLVRDVGANKLFFFDSSLANNGARIVNPNFVPAGARGTDGIDGIPGAPGSNSYVHFAYANSPDGSADFTTGQPGDRAYEGTYSDSNPSDSGNPASYTWRQYFGPPFGIATRGTVTVAGRQLLKQTGVYGWDSDAFSTSGYQGGASTSFQFQSLSSAMAGLNIDPLTDASYGSIDYAWYATDAGTCQIYENGGYIGDYGAYDSSTRFQVHYDGRYVRYFKNDVLIRGPLDVGANLMLYFDSSIAVPGSRITNIDFSSAGTLGDKGDTGNPGAPGADAQAIVVAVSPQSIRFDKYGNVISGNVVFQATRKNIAGGITWYSGVGHSIYNTPGVDISADGSTLTMSAQRAADVLNYNQTVVGISSETLTAAIGSVSGVATITKVQDGQDGAPGSPGPPGASAYNLTSNVNSLTFLADYQGNLKSGQLAQVIVFEFTKGGENVSTGVDWDVPEFSGCAGSMTSAGLVTFTGVLTSGYVRVSGTFEGVTKTMKIPITLAKDAPPANSDENASVRLNSTTVNSNSYPATPQTNVTVSCPSGTLRARYQCDYAVQGAGNCALEFMAGYRLAGTNNAWTYYPAVAGSLARVNNNNPQEPINDTGFASANQVASVSPGRYEVGLFARRYQGLQGGSLTAYHEGING